MGNPVIQLLPTLNALLNATSAVLLAMGYIEIKKRHRPDRHKRLMLTALLVSALFLTSYLTYHAQVGSVHYPLHDWTRTLYRAILFPHMILAGLMVPFVIAAVWLGLKGKFRAHTRITKRLWPVWMFVSVTGVVVYLLLYVWAGARAL
jgi:putative membrane protein